MLNNKRVCVTGGEGFLGQYIVEKLIEHGCSDIVIPRHKEYDLRRREDVNRMYRLFSPDMVIHAAASCGGIQACSSNQGKFLYDNLVMGAELIDAAREYGVEKFVQISSVCAYPLHVQVPAKEDDIWTGYPESTNSAYGIAKRVLLTACQAYREQYGLEAIGLIPVNLYGPGDTIDPKRSHAIPALIRKCVEAKEKGDSLVVWGTGSASREFLYVADCAEAIVLATEKYSGSGPVNIGTGTETTIRSLVHLIADAVGFEGSIEWDSTKPDGQLRRLFDVSRAKKEFGFEAKVGLEEGIERTVSWFINQKG